MEHSSKKDLSAINALFYYPIKSIVYCGALRFVNYFDTRDREPRSWKFVPIDTEIAQLNDNQKNPPLFVVFLKGIDPSSKKQIIECHVFIVGAIKTAMKLVECCQKAFSLSKESVLDFYKKFGNVPVVYCMKNQLKDRDDKRIVVKIYDTNGYFYAVENTPIEIWELFEKSEVFYESISKGKGFNPYSRSNCVQKECDQIYSDLMPNQDEQAGVSCKNREELNEKKLIIDPYEKSENLVKVEKRVDPITGQNIYVRYLADTNTAKTNTTKTYDIPTQLYDNEIESDIEIEIDEAEKCKKKQPPIIIRQEKTPSPIIVEKYIKKKAPQVIIKEIHVHEPAPPPVKIVQTMDNQYSDGNMEEQDVPIYGMRNPVPFPRAGPVPIPRIGPRPGVMIRPMPVPYSGPQIRMSNPNNPRPLISNNPALYTSPKSLLNQVYGTSRLPPPIEYRHTTDNLYSREPFPFYSNRPIPMNNYKKFNTDIGLGPITPGRSYNKNDGLYDFGEIKPRFVNYEPTIGIGHRNYSSLKNINSRPPVHYNRYGTIDFPTFFSISLFFSIFEFKKPIYLNFLNSNCEKFKRNKKISLIYFEFLCFKMKI